MLNTPITCLQTLMTPICITQQRQANVITVMVKLTSGKRFNPLVVNMVVVCKRRIRQVG